MAETKWIQYGDKKMPLGELTLDQAKATMARYFPELADPKIEPKKNGDETIYVFSKKAGTKGSDLARVTSSLLKRQRTATVPAAALQLAQAINGGTGNVAKVQVGDARALEVEAEKVSELRERLLNVEPSVVNSGVILL